MATIVPSTGNLLDADVDALVNTVNCEGVMGKGVALQFKQAYPEMFRAYEKAAKAGEVMPGRMHVFETGKFVGPRYIFNFPTKKHWRARSRIEYIEAGLRDLVDRVRSLGIHSIAVPALGSGNGGLDWSDVRPRIVQAFEQLPSEVQVLLYEPRGEPTGSARRASPKRPNMTLARALLLQLMELYRIPDYTLTLLEVQKLAYFLQAAGQPLRLNFINHTYGPYAHNLYNALQHLEGHFLHGATDTKPGTEIRLAEGAVEEARAFLREHDEASERLDRVATLIEGFETPYGMEILATVHWVATHDPAACMDSASCVAGVHGWNERKRRIFQPHHIEVAWERLATQGWFAGSTTERGA
jgi:O-acetyl-ADP-ribose deacetylase (regulator of RNase III)